MNQTRLGDEIGNLIVSPVESKTLTIDDSGEGAYWEWTSDGRLPFHIKAQSAGLLRVVLIGEDEADAKVMPFHEGWNAERVWRVYHDENYGSTGVTVAGR
jgi:hypothetical protein